MKNTVMNDETADAVRELGRLIRTDARYIALNEAEEKYNNDPEMTKLIPEYNVQQSALASQYAEKERDNDMIKAIEKRIGEIYDAVTKNDLYEEYLRAKADYDELYGEISALLQTEITGRAPCTHDCSTCGGCH